jgi:hypothetical protein
MRATRIATIAGCLLFISPAAMFGAQLPHDSVHIALRLRVVTTANAPVSDAEVALKLDRLVMHVRTDSVGDARFALTRDGLYRATIRRIGFGAAIIDVRVGTGDNVLIVHLDKASATLDEVRIVADRLTVARLDDFERRRLRGDANATVTQAQIEHRGPVKLSQMLRDIPGLRVADSSGSTVLISKRSLKVLRDLTLAPCVMRLTIDGVVMPALANIDAIVPKDVYGIEIFSGPARLPPELDGLRTDNWCGVIAIWTRDR